LIVVEGINWWGVVPVLGSGARPHLMPVRERPVVLQRPNKLVYAAHNYGFTGPHHNGDDRTSPGQLRYRDYDEAALRELLDKEWGFVLDSQQPYTAPVWVSEFGVAHQ